jgi:transposase-like protein
LRCPLRSIHSETGEVPRHRRHSSVSIASSAFAGFRFPTEVITVAVRWYLRFGLSYRDVEELLAERGVEVDHVSVYRWVQRFTPIFAEAARPSRHAVGDRWHVDETYVKVAGTWRYLYRAMDQFGQVVDVFLSVQRDARAARQFFADAMTRNPDRARRGRHRPGPGVPGRARGAATRRLPRRRAVRQQQG